MSCRVKEKNKKNLHVEDVPFGKIGVITENGIYHGLLVITNEDGCGYSILGKEQPCINLGIDFYSSTVRILEPGELIEVRYS